MTDHVTRTFGQGGMLQTLGARLVSVEDGKVVIEAEVSDATSQQHGFGHAGLTFSIADSSAGLAAMTTLPADFGVVTSEFRISLLAPARGLLRAEGRVVRPGRKLVAVAADVWGDDGAHVATALGTMVPVKGAH